MSAGCCSPDDWACLPSGARENVSCPPPSLTISLMLLVVRGGITAPSSSRFLPRLLCVEYSCFRDACILLRWLSGSSYRHGCTVCDLAFARMCLIDKQCSISCQVVRYATAACPFLESPFSRAPLSVLVRNVSP